MKKKVLHVGLDVDDKSFHIGAFCKETGETFELSTRPHAGNLMKKFENFTDKNFELKMLSSFLKVFYFFADPNPKPNNFLIKLIK